MSDAVVVESVVAFEPLRLGESGSRRAIARWSDGSVSEALRWYDDEALVFAGDVIGKSAADLRSLKFGRGREFLQRTDN